MTASIILMTHILRVDFGFEHLLWVYSGRRGVHCWVSDIRARKLNNDQRSSIIEYSSIYLGKDIGKSMNLSYPLHPSFERSFLILEPYFINCLIKEQGLLSSQESCKFVLEYFDVSIRDEFLFTSMSLDPIDKWSELKSKVARLKQNPNFMKRPGSYSIRTVIERIVFSHIYPRLDINVSKQLNHLLKSPFCIHPKTGRICVPIEPNNIELFNPFNVPTVAQLDYELSNGGINKIKQNKINSSNNNNNSNNNVISMDDEDDRRDSVKQKNKYDSDDDDNNNQNENDTITNNETFNSENQSTSTIKDDETKVKSETIDKNDRNNVTWHDTSLEPYLTYFKKFVSAQQFENRREANRLNNSVSTQKHEKFQATGGVEEIDVTAW